MNGRNLFQCIEDNATRVAELAKDKKFAIKLHYKG